ncbi:MAG TPA: pyridoxamine 5'-phosphate oxidase [Cytophagales bacterium]|nr:pyridoxamine 5'-phosphate oxidase [Cytophagales bacterium]HAA23815.1 pyridoxamine 5'-phosphate oxidase [Cytophagales bacterium]
MASLADLREEYVRHQLNIADAATDPMVQFNHWLQEAMNAEVPEPNAFTLSTVDQSGQPFSRVVLLKGLENGKFVFYTNFQSRKGLQLAENPKVALSFLWLELERQVTVLGTAKKQSAASSDAYFAVRPRGSQLGAWTSPQSEEIPNRAFLEERERTYQKKFEGQEVPRPDHWGGYDITPHSVEFWQGRRSRLHDRLLYTQTNEGKWDRRRLAP